MIQVVWRRRRSGGDRGHHVRPRGSAGLEAVAAAFAAPTRPRPRPSTSALILRKDPGGERLYAARGFRCGDRVLALDEVVWRPERDGETVEHPFGGHLYHPVLAKAAHSCAPNCRVDFTARALFATAAIAAGDPITTDYQSTDRRISRPFDCRCGARRCRGRIA